MVCLTRGIKEPAPTPYRRSLVHRVFNSQMKDKIKRDWVTTVLQDLQLLGMNDLSIEEIRIMKKTVWMNMIKQKINLYTFETLNNVKKSHLKVKHIEYTEINIKNTYSQTI